MKSECQEADGDARHDRRLLLFLEGGMDHSERAVVESDLAQDPDLAARLEGLRHILDQSGQRSAPLLSQTEIAAIAAGITRTPRGRSRRRPVALGLAAAACAAVMLFLILVPNDAAPPAAELEWDSEALWTLSRDVSVAGMALDDAGLNPASGEDGTVWENTDRSLLELRLRLARLEASFESLDERIFP